MQKEVPHDSQERILERVSSISKEARELLEEVLRLEDAKLGMKNPRGMKEDFADLTERIVSSLKERK